MVAAGADEGGERSRARWGPAIGVLALVAAVLAGALAGTGEGRTATASPPTTSSLQALLVDAAQIPAEFKVAALPSDAVPDWCRAAAFRSARPIASAAVLYVADPTPSSRASIANYVFAFRPGEAERFMAAMRTSGGCANPVLAHVDGVTTSGSVARVPIDGIGDDRLIEEIGGNAVWPGQESSTSGRVARIIVREGDLVAVMTDAAYGMNFDPGLRNRLATTAGSQLPGVP